MFEVYCLLAAACFVQDFCLVPIMSFIVDTGLDMITLVAMNVIWVAGLVIMMTGLVVGLVAAGSKVVHLVSIDINNLDFTFH